MQYIEVTHTITIEWGDEARQFQGEHAIDPQAEGESIRKLLDEMLSYPDRSIVVTTTTKEA